MFNYGQNRPLPGLRLGCAGCLLESPDPQPKTCVDNIFIKMLVMLIGDTFQIPLSCHQHFDGQNLS